MFESWIYTKSNKIETIQREKVVRKSNECITNYDMKTRDLSCKYPVVVAFLTVTGMGVHLSCFEVKGIRWEHIMNDMTPQTYVPKRRGN